MEPGNITLLDAQRWFHPIIMKGRCRYQGVRWVDSKSPDRWDTAESVTFTRDHPAPGGNFWMPRDYTQADHIVNMCLMKAHGCGITPAWSVRRPAAPYGTRTIFPNAPARITAT